MVKESSSVLVQELRATLGKLEVALGAIAEAIVWTDQDGNVQWCTGSFDRLVDHSHISVLGRPLRHLLPLSQHQRLVDVACHPITLLLAGHPTVAGEYAFHRSNRELALEIRGTRIEATPGRLSAIMVIRDVTEQQRAKEQLRSAYGRLRETQAHLVESEKLAALGQFGAGLAHEVKNPLHIISVAVDLLIMKRVTDPQKSLELFTVIKEAVGRADRIIRSLLNYAKPAAFRLAPDDLHRVIDASLDLFRQQLADQGVTVTRVLEAAPLTVRLDAEKMQQVLANLILNAIQAMPRGGRLTLRTSIRKPSEIDLQLGRQAADRFLSNDAVVVCEVEDAGIGIPAAVLPQVFDPFFTTKASTGGTGLGLSITKTIVEAHGGVIGMTSHAGKGTTVSFALPLADRGAGAEGEP